MTRKIFTIICAIGLFGSASFAQTGYSESVPYKPREFPQTEKQKKKAEKKMKEPGTAAPVAVNGDETVTIPISVFDTSGAFINGLTRGDFSVFVDGAEVPIRTFEKAAGPPKVIILLDTSPSAEQRFKLMREQAAKFVQALPAETQVMVVDFHAEMKVRSRMTLDRAETQRAIEKGRMGSGTAIYGAIQTMFQKILPEVSGRKIILLMTDGVDTVSRDSTFLNSIAEVEKSDVSIYPVYFDTFGDIASSMKKLNGPLGNMFPLPPMVTTGSSEKEYKLGLIYLNDLAVASGGRIFSSEKLEAGTRSLLEELSSKYYATISVPKTGSGTRQLKIRVKRPGVAIFTRGSFIDQ